MDNVVDSKAPEVQKRRKKQNRTRYHKKGLGISRVQQTLNKIREGTKMEMKEYNLRLKLNLSE